MASQCVRNRSVDTANEIMLASLGSLDGSDQDVQRLDCGDISQFPCIVPCSRS
jgi:hypothetical protein